MKKTLIFAAAALTVFAACSKEQDIVTPEVLPDGKVRATFVAEVEQTKVTESLESNSIKFAWQAQDAVAVIDKNDDAINYFFCTDDADAAEGIFTGTHSGEFAYAIAPFEVATSMEEVSDATTSLVEYTITLPGAYSDYVPGTTNAIMVGTPNGANKFLFRHVAAILKFTVANVPVGTKSFWLKTSKKITGDYTFNSLTGVEISETATTDTEVALELKDAVTTPNQTLSFYVPVPTGDYTDFMVTLYDENLGELAKKSKSGLSITLNRGDVYYTPTITLAAVDIPKGAEWTYTFEEKVFTANGTKTLSGTTDMDWTLAGDGDDKYWGYDATKGQQFGSGTKAYASLSLTSSFGATYGISDIKINTSGASSIAGTVSVSVGGVDFKCGNDVAVGLTNAATDYTFSSPDGNNHAGDVVISYEQTSSKAIYLKSITINPAGQVAQVATPTFSPDGGSFTETQNVTIACATDGATIYYTLDGTAPTIQSTEYTAPIEISATTTIKAIAVKDGMTDSEIAEATYTISSGTTTGTYYTKVTSVNDIVSGDKYVIVGSAGEKNYALPAEPTLNNGKITGTEIAISANGISESDVTGLLWTLTKSGDNYSLYDESGYLYHSNGGASGTNLGYGNAASYLWNISAAPDGSNGTFKFAGVVNDVVKDRGMLATTGGVFGGYSLSNITASGYCGIDLYTLVDNTVWNLESIAVKTAPTKTAYTAGENFDPTGLVITATYADAAGVKPNKTKDVTYAGINASKFTFEPALDAGLTANDTQVTITYEGKSATQEITVTEPLVPVAKPTFSPDAGTYDAAQNVTISCATAGATIYYTTDGSDPTTSSTPYSAPVEISSTTTLKAFAVKDGMADSEVAEATYTINSGTDTYYTKVTSVNDIVSGNKYVVVGTYGTTNYALPAGPTLASGKIAGTEITISANGISDSDVTGLLWTLTKSGDNYSLSDGNGYLYHSNGGGSGTNLGYGDTASYLWNITAAPDGSNGTFKFAGVNGTTVNSRGMLVNSSGSFGGYALSNITSSDYCGIDLYTLADNTVWILSSIAVKTAPTKLVYTAGENFDPTGLVITATFSDAAGAKPDKTQDITYAGINASKFSFDPALDAELTVSVTSVTITYDGKSTTQQITVNAAPLPKVETPAFDPAAGAVNAGTSVTISCATDGAAIHYTLDGSDPSASSTLYSAPIVLNDATTIKAIAVKDNYQDSDIATAAYTINASTAGSGTFDDPYTAGDILTLYPSGSDDTEVYVTGTITGITEVSTQHGNATYTISDGTNTILVYRGKYIDGADFTSADQIAVNDAVVVYGIINTYNNVPQLAQGNNLVSINGKSKVLTAGTLSATPDPDNMQIAVTWGAASGTDAAISYVVTCGTQTHNADAAGSHTFTMTNYDTYTVSVVASAADALSVTVSTSVILAVGANDGSEQKPFTVAEAVAAYTANSSIGDKYVKGIISQAGWTSNNKTNCYISDDGTTTAQQFELYNITSGQSAADLTVGSAVLAHGTITKYNSTYETSPSTIAVLVAMPSISGEENFTATAAVTISSSAGATIYYTLDGTDPSTSSSEYTSALNITATTIVKAIAVKDGLVTAIASKTFTKVQAYAVTWSAPSNGSITVKQGDTEITSGALVPQNATINITVTPDNGYALASLVYNDGTEHDIKSAKSFSMPGAAVSITATFESTGGGTSTATLTGTNMSSMSNAGTGYNTAKSVTVGSFTWSTNGYQTSALKNMIQLRVRTNSSGVSYIQLPTFPGDIQSISLNVTDANATSYSTSSNACGATLAVQSGTTKNETVLVSGTASSNVITLDLSSKNVTTGYIVSTNAAARIWEITVTYNN